MAVHRLAVNETEQEIEPEMQRRFLDFLFDGESLHPRLLARGIDSVTPLWIDDDVARHESVAAARQLLGEIAGDAPGGRVAVYVCRLCGDLGSGAVTVRLTVGSDSVVWSDWGWQTNYSDEIFREDFGGFPELEFERTEYEGVLRDALERLTRTSLPIGVRVSTPDRAICAGRATDHLTFSGRVTWVKAVWCAGDGRLLVRGGGFR